MSLMKQALAPDSILFTGRANSLFTFGRYTGHWPIFNKALELNSKHADSYFWRAHAFENLKTASQCKK